MKNIHRELKGNDEAILNVEEINVRKMKIDKKRIYYGLSKRNQIYESNDEDRSKRSNKDKKTNNICVWW